MKENKFTGVSDEQLAKNIKAGQLVTYMLGAALIALFIINIYNSFKKGFTALSVVPLALLPILILNISNLSAMKKEQRSRKP